MLGRDELDQTVAQAAAWHLSDGLSWAELAQKVRVKHLNGTVQMYFNHAQLQQATSAVQLALHRAAESSVLAASQASAQSEGEAALRNE
jgi:hypothetical protein